MSDAEVMTLLEQARTQFERYVTVQNSSVAFRDQLEVQYSPAYLPEAPIGLVIYGDTDGIVV